MSISQSLRQDDRRDVLSLLLLALLCYADKLLLGPYAVIDFYDAVEVHFSHFKNMAALWSEFGAFSWYPFHAGGVPSFMGQHPPYSPAVFLAAVLPLWLLALLWNVGQMFLAGYGMHRFLRLLPQVSRQVSLLIAALYSLTWVSGNVHVVMSYAFPALFAWTVDLFRSDLSRLKRFTNALLILLVSLFSYPVLTLPHFPILHLALVLFLGRHLPDFRRQVLGVFVVWTGYVLLYIPSIVSLFLYIPYAQRDWNFHDPGLGPAFLDFVHWIKGRLGSVPLLGLVFFALPLATRKTLRTSFLILAAMLLVSGIFNSDLKGIFAGSFLLKMDLFMFATALGVITSLIAALAVETYATQARSFTWWHLLAILAVLPLFGAAHKVLGYALPLGAGAAAVILLRRGLDSISQRNVSIAMTALLVCLAGTGMILRQQNMTTGMFVPYAKGYMGHPALASLALEAPKPFRVATMDVHPAVVQSYGLDTVGGKSPLFNKYYKEYVREIVRPQLPTGKLVTQFDDLWRQLYLTRNKIDHDQYGVTITAPQPRTAADLNWPLLLAMNVTHVVSAAPVTGLEQLASRVEASPGLDSEAPWLKKTGLASLYSLPLWIYTLDAPQDRAYLASPVVLESRSEVLSALGASSSEALRSAVFLAKEDLPGPVAHRALDKAAAGQVRIASWSPDLIVLEGQASKPCVLVVSNNFDPRWQAQSEGRKLPVFRANHAFQGISIDQAGPFRIELSFKSPLIWWLNLASLAGVLLLFSAVLFRQASNQAPEAAPAPPEAPAALSWSRCLAAGAGVAAVWALSFAFFVQGRHKGPQVDTLGYALATIPVLGVFVALWGRRLARLLSGYFHQSFSRRN